MAHEVRALCLTEGSTPHAYIGRLFTVGDRSLEWTEDHADALAPDVERVKHLAAGRTLMTEVRVPISHWTREAGAEGTSDVVVIDLEAREMWVDDLKFGQGVKVEARANEQLRMYGLGTLEFLKELDFVPEKIHLIISQPRLDWVDEEVLTLEQLLKFGEHVHTAAVTTTLPDAPRKPGDKQCRWCPAKADCDAAQQYAIELVQGDFTDLTQHTVIEHAVVQADAERVARMLWAADFLEQLIRAYRQRGEAMLFGGVKVPGWKVVAGKKGNRAWTDESQVQELCKEKFRLPDEEVFERSLKSPAKLEKRLKKEPKRWAQLQQFIKQADGRPSIAPESDPRAEYQPAAQAGEFNDDSIIDV